MDTQHTDPRHAAEGRKINLADAPTGPQGERLLAAGDRLGMRLWVEERPVDGPTTTRAHETVGFALKGQATLVVGDRRVELRPGDSWVVPAGVPHAYRIAHSFAAVEATSPPPEREPELRLRDSGATMSSATDASSASTAYATARVSPGGFARPAALSAAAAADSAERYPTPRRPSRATEADGPYAEPAPSEHLRTRGYGGVGLLGPRVEASDFARRQVRRHDLARRLRGSPATVFAVLRGASGPERWLPELPPGRDYVRFVGQDRRLEWGASDDSWQAWFDAHTVRGTVVEIQASLTTAYDVGDPRAPSASEIVTALRAMLEAIGAAVDPDALVPAGEATREAAETRDLPGVDGRPGELRRF